MENKYFKQPLLARGFQKRDGATPGGLAFLPQIKDVTAIPEGTEYFYYSGETTDQFINGYIYKHFKGQETIIIPEHKEERTAILPALTDYIDVLEPGYAFPVGRYYKVAETEKLPIKYFISEYDNNGETWQSSYLDILSVGAYAWKDYSNERSKIVAINRDYPQTITLENGLVLNYKQSGGSLQQEHAYISAEGLKGWFALSMEPAGMGIYKEFTQYGETNLYLYSDGLVSVLGSARRGRTTAEETFTYFDIIPEHSETIEVDEYRQIDAQPRKIARLENEDGSKYILVETNSILIEGNAVASGNFTVKGDLIVEGKEIVSDVETIQSEDDFILLRFNNPAALGENYSGLKFLNYDGAGAALMLVVKGDGILRLGLADSLEPVTTRDEAAAMEANGVTIWDADGQKLKTATAITNIVKSFVQTSQTQITEMNAMTQSVYDGLTIKNDNKLYVII